VFDLLYWLFRVPVGLALVIGLIVLIRHRHRSRKAAGLALAALSVLGGWWLAWLIADVTNVWRLLPIEWRDVVHWTAIWVRELCLAGCLLLLVIAVLADRGGPPPTAPEADYADPREQ
jgi:hypothetical protein